MGIIQNKRAILQVLGGLIKNPKLLKEEKYDIKLEDFQEPLHRVLFLTINNLYNQQVYEITGVTIDNYISTYPKQYKLFQDNRGVDLVDRLIATAQDGSFDYWHDVLKKFSLLREFNEHGFDVSDLYDPNEIDVAIIEEKNSKLDEMTVQDILAHYNKKFLKIRDNWASNDNGTAIFQAGYGLSELKERLKKAPSVGHSFINPVLTTAVRGMRKKKLVLVSGSSGSGKSRQQMANACHVAVGWIYNLKANRWELTGEKPLPTLYISTELEQSEIQTIMLAYITGIEEHKILDGSYTEEEEQRLNVGIRLLENAPLYCKYISDFDIKDIENLIEMMIIDKKVEFVFYDYLHSTPKILQYYNQNTGTRLQEHQILYLFGNSLKMLVNQYDIFMYSSTQLNRGYKDEANLDASSIRGALSLSDKIDCGIISVPPTKKDLEMLDALCMEIFTEPNMCHTIYKNRGNRYKDIRIWTKINLGNMREEVLFVTDGNYNRINIKSTRTNNLTLEERETEQQLFNKILEELGLS